MDLSDHYQDDQKNDQIGSCISTTLVTATAYFKKVQFSNISVFPLWGLFNQSLLNIGPIACMGEKIPNLF